MKPKKILGIVLAIIFGTLFVGGGFLVLFLVTQSNGWEIWQSVLLAFVPFVVPAIIYGIVWLIVTLIYD